MRGWTLFTVVLLLLTAGCLGADTTPTKGETSTPPTEKAPFEPVAYTFEGEFLAGGADAPQTYTFQVPNGTTEVMGLLTWSMPGAALDFQLYDPTGEEAADGWGESDQHRFVTTTRPVVPGEWTVEVTAQRGADIHYTMEIEARQGEPFGPIERTYTVEPQDFAEINLNMVPGDAFNFTWQADSEVYFNLHYHADGETQRPLEHTGTALEGTFTAPATQVYSLLWRNEGVLPVEVTVTMDGTYRLHSMTRASPSG